MPLSEKINEHLREWARALGLSPSRVARMAGVSKSTITRIFNDPDYSASYRAVARIWNALERYQEGFLKELGKFKAEEVAGGTLEAISVDMRVESVVRLMEERDYSVVPVRKGDRIVGKVTRRDILEMLSSERTSFLSERVCEVYEKVAPVIVRPDASIYDVIPHIQRDELVVVKTPEGERALTWWDVLEWLRRVAEWREGESTTR